MDEKKVLQSTWARVLSAIAALDRVDSSAAVRIRLDLTASLDAVAQIASGPLSPGGVDTPGSGQIGDARVQARNFTPLRDHFVPAAQAAMSVATGMSPSGRDTADWIGRIREAVTPAQAAHRAWEWARRRIRAIEDIRPGDACGYWNQSTAFCVGVALAAPARHAPQQFATLDGAIAHATRQRTTPEGGAS